MGEIKMQKNLLLVALLLAFGTGAGSAAETDAQRVDAVLPQVTAWRRDITSIRS